MADNDFWEEQLRNWVEQSSNKNSARALSPKTMSGALTNRSKVKRMSLLPYPQLGADGSIDMTDWVAPQVAIDLIESAQLPGQVYRGEKAGTPEEARKMAVDVNFGSALLGKAPAGSLGMNMLRREPKMPSPYAAAPGSDPKYLGAAPDRTDMSFLRYTPKKNTARVEASIAALRDPENPMRQQMMADIEKGQKLGGDDWYNTEELRDWFVKEHGAKEGHRQWAEYMDLMGATSPGSKVPANMGNASAMRQRMYSEEIPGGSNRTTGEIYRDDLAAVDNLETARPLARGREPGYGHKTQGLQELIAARQAQGNWTGGLQPGVPAGKGSWRENPKPKGFAQSLKGSERNIAADLHFTRYMAMASKDPEWLSGNAEIGQDVLSKLRSVGGDGIEKYIKTREKDGKVLTSFNVKKAAKDGAITVDEVSKLDSPQMWAEKPNDSEYAAMEQLMYEIGKETGQTGPQLQASLWMGAADRTGVDPTSQGTFMELLRRRAAKRGEKEGLTEQQVLKRFVKDRGLLSNPGDPLSAAAALQKQYEDEQLLKFLETGA